MKKTEKKKAPWKMSLGRFVIVRVSCHFCFLLFSSFSLFDIFVSIVIASVHVPLESISSSVGCNKFVDYSVAVVVFVFFLKFLQLFCNVAMDFAANI